VGNEDAVLMGSRWFEKKGSNIILIQT